MMKKTKLLLIFVVIVFIFAGCKEKEEYNNTLETSEEKKYEVIIKESMGSDSIETEFFYIEPGIHVGELNRNKNIDNYISLELKIKLFQKDWWKEYKDVVIIFTLDESFKDQLMIPRTTFESLPITIGNNQASGYGIEFSHSTWLKNSITKQELEELLKKDIAVNISWDDGSESINVTNDEIEIVSYDY